jgi:glutathione S-transferase
MLLYHWEPNAASARVLIALKEKSLEFESRYVDLHAFEQHEPEFLALNSTGQVPVLVRDGEAFTETSAICEYLDEAFPENPLMPEAPLERWEARSWQKYVDDHFAQAVSEIAWNARRPKALVGARAPYSDEEIAQAEERIELAIAKVDESLGERDWLVGDAFSLADIAVFSYAYYLTALMPDVIAGSRKRTRHWLVRVSEREGVKAALAMSRTGEPFLTAAPGPERVRWG